ncbi:chondroitin sulfate synthase 1 isoform X2 [Halyomorpha halys]|uniref:chondroitin sulfate synthase 1 isoform X2 n=1 Tax=Halyomorpha halys TaxID=286706 RepID=UPI0006D4EEAE|nr:chondroitin sulfate synthase 1 isoform X2 [Halyomorpha halys]
MVGRRRALGLLPPLLLGLLLGRGLGPRGGCAPSGGPLPLPNHHPQLPPSSGGRDLLFVGVMTAKKYLPTRAAAVHRTWGQQVPGRIEFFSSYDSIPPPNDPLLPLVRLPGVDDSYPPQKKSFMMLQYMWERYGNSYEWFLRADDDVYIRPDKMETLLRSVDSKKAHFIGQAGRGNQEEFGLLSLEYDENFCMGGPGVIMSREVLARVAPHIRYCLKNLYTTHEDVELGRCVQKFAGVSCTWSYEMQTILYHNSSGKEAFTGNLKQKEVHRAITLHPVKQHKHLYRIHNYMQMLKVQELQQDMLSLHRDILSMSQILDIENKMDIFDDSVQFGQPPGLTKYIPKTDKDLIPWDFIQRSLYSAFNANPRRRIDAPLKEGLDDVIREVMEKINKFSKQRGRVIDFKEILYGYVRYNPIHGADYILDLLLLYKKYRGRKMTVPVRRHAYLQQQFTDISIREVLETDEINLNNDPSEDAIEAPGNLPGIKDVFGNGLIKLGGNIPSILFPIATDNSRELRRSDKMINFILPLSGRFEIFKRFMGIFEEECLRNEERVTLTVVLFPNDKEDSVSKTLSLIKMYQENYRYTKIEVLPQFENFARASALEIGASHIEEPNDLLFFIDVDMVFRRGSLQRIRKNTIRKKSVYFPIVYSEFDPIAVFNQTISLNHFLIDETTGYWRQYGFGIGSVYKTDLIEVGSFDTTIKGWGKEDVDLFEKFITASKNISIFRSVDPDLVHVFHIVECDPKLDDVQLRMCQASRADTYGSVAQLTRYIKENHEIFNRFLQKLN